MGPTDPVRGRAGCASKHNTRESSEQQRLAEAVGAGRWLKTAPPAAGDGATVRVF